MLNGSSDLKYENVEGSGSFSPHVRNQATINDEMFCAFEESYVVTVGAMYVTPDLVFVF